MLQNWKQLIKTGMYKFCIVTEISYTYNDRVLARPLVNDFALFSYNCSTIWM